MAATAQSPLSPSTPEPVTGHRRSDSIAESLSGSPIEMVKRHSVVSRKPLPILKDVPIQKGPESPVRVTPRENFETSEFAIREGQPHELQDAFQSRPEIETPEPEYVRDSTSSIPATQTLPYRVVTPQTEELQHVRHHSQQAEFSFGGDGTRDSGNYDGDEEFPMRRENSDEVAREPKPAKMYPALQYHHEAFEDRGIRKVSNGSEKGAGHRASAAFSQNSSPGNENSAGRHLHPVVNSWSRGPSPRPDSVVSGYSEGDRGRRLSPSNIPSHHRNVSNTSSDGRRAPYSDQINIPYPQPPPAAGGLDNSGLKGMVGSNLSLLSRKATLEMYRTNAKKTNDPQIQYEFAMFMIQAANEIKWNASESNSPPRTSSPGSNFDGASDPTSGVTADQLLKEAKTTLQRLSDRSYPYAQYYLGDGYASGMMNRGKPDNEKAFPLFVAAGKHGHAEAGFRAALCYEFGWGCRKDPVKASQFYRQAASKSHPGAMLRLGKACLLKDLGLGYRYREGINWLKRATEFADEQYPQAPYELGVLHEQGFGADVFKDESYTCQLFTRAAELGHPEANYRLGDAYEHGKLGCPKDPALSIHFYNGAASRDHIEAMMALCAWYLVGAEPILEKDENEAYEWARRAAEMGKSIQNRW
jgi:TPR repeat protein